MLQEAIPGSSMALYAAAAAVLAGVESRQGSIKSLVYGSRFQVAGQGPGGRRGRARGLPRPLGPSVFRSPAPRRT